VVDVYGAVTAVSLCGPVIDTVHCDTATVPHSLTNVSSVRDAMSDEPADVTPAAAAAAAAAAMVCVFTGFLNVFHVSCPQC